MRRASWPLAGAVVGLAVALAFTLVQDSTYRADASLVLVREGRPPGNDPELAEAAEAAAQLFESRAVAASALTNLGLEEGPDEFAARIDADAEPGSSLVVLHVEGSSEEEARRAAQEVAEVSTVLFNDRFGPQTVASVWEPAESDPERVSPRPARNAALGVVAGALLGWALVLALAGRLPRAPKRAQRRTEEPVAGTVPISDDVVTEPSHERSGTVPAEAVPAEDATGPFVMPALGEWTIGDVERLVAGHGGAFPERAEEIRLYLDTFRSVAGPDGRLPGDVDLVIEDVFADLIARSGSARRA